MYPNSNNKLKKIITISLLIILVGLIVWFMLAYYINKAAKDQQIEAGTIFMEKLLKGEPDTYKSLSQGYQKRMVNENNWGSSVGPLGSTQNTFKQTGAGEVAQYEKSYPKNSSPIMITYFVNINGTSFNYKIVVIKENNQWKIDEAAGYTP